MLLTTGTPPRIISLSVVKNEQDIIEPCIRHNIAFLDFMIILDNGSNDATRNIISELMRELGNVVLADHSDFGHWHSERITRLLHFCQTAFFADYVVLLDADEFIDAPDRITFESILGTIMPGGIGLVPWRTFVLAPEEGEKATLDPPRSIKWCRAAEIPLYKKAILRLDGSCFHDLRISQGNHSVVSEKGRELPCMDLDGLALAHFPVRSRNQLLVKSIVGWMAMLRKNPNVRETGECYQWRENFDLLLADPNVPHTFVCESSIRYAQDRPRVQLPEDIVASVPPGNYIRKYSTGEFGEPISIIAKAWESSLSPPRSVINLRHPNNLFVDIPPFRYVFEKYLPDSVCDVGCGIGAYLKVFQSLGVTQIFGIDAIPADTTMLDETEYAVHDLSGAFRLGRKFDLVVCVEVAEHMKDNDAARLLSDIDSHSPEIIIFSAAEPGQPGNGHINCRPIIDWLKRWRSLGWGPDLGDSLAMRSLATLSWLRRNLVVLKKLPGDSAETAVQALQEIADRPFSWYSQPPGIRYEVLSEDPPQPPQGYISDAVPMMTKPHSSGWLRKIAGWMPFK
ncbi:MAG: glycosyltransferase family 2 protein [Syntrophobacteraceae bacterium]